MMLRPPCSTLFPYTTLFRSIIAQRGAAGIDRLVEDGADRLGEPGGATVADTRRQPARRDPGAVERLARSEEHTSELQSRQYLVCRLLLEKKKNATSSINQ